MAIADKPRGHGHAEACELTRGDPPRRICRASPRCQPGERHRPRAMKALPTNPRTAGGCSPRHMVRRTRTGACRSAATPRARHGVRYTGRPVGVARDRRQGRLSRGVGTRAPWHLRPAILGVLESGLWAPARAAFAGADFSQLIRRSGC